MTYGSGLYIMCPMSKTNNSKAAPRKTYFVTCQDTGRVEIETDSLYLACKAIVGKPNLNVWRRADRAPVAHWFEGVRAAWGANDQERAQIAEDVGILVAA